MGNEYAVGVADALRALYHAVHGPFHIGRDPQGHVWFGHFDGKKWILLNAASALELAAKVKEALSE